MSLATPATASPPERSRRIGVDVAGFLRRATLFVHGSTVATNTVLEGAGAIGGLLVTEGFRDFLEIRRGQRANPWDHRTPYPPVLVPRYLRLPVGGRIDREGRKAAAPRRGRHPLRRSGLP